MSYQRPSERHFYVWMGSDGLHLMEGGADIVFSHDTAGRDNAKAMLRGLFDLLASEGIQVKIKGDTPQFQRKDRP